MDVEKESRQPEESVIVSDSLSESTTVVTEDKVPKVETRHILADSENNQVAIRMDDLKKNMVAMVKAPVRYGPEGKEQFEKHIREELEPMTRSFLMTFGLHTDCTYETILEHVFGQNEAAYSSYEKMFGALVVSDPEYATKTDTLCAPAIFFITRQFFMMNKRKPPHGFYYLDPIPDVNEHGDVNMVVMSHQEAFCAAMQDHDGQPGTFFTRWIMGLEAARRHILNAQSIDLARIVDPKHPTSQEALAVAACFHVLCNFRGFPEAAPAIMALLFYKLNQEESVYDWFRKICGSSTDVLVQKVSEVYNMALQDSKRFVGLQTSITDFFRLTYGTNFKSAVDTIEVPIFVGKYKRTHDSNESVMKNEVFEKMVDEINASDRKLQEILTSDNDAPKSPHPMVLVASIVTTFMNTHFGKTMALAKQKESAADYIDTASAVWIKSFSVLSVLSKACGVKSKLERVMIQEGLDFFEYLIGNVELNLRDLFTKEQKRSIDSWTKVSEFQKVFQSESFQNRTQDLWDRIDMMLAKVDDELARSKISGPSNVHNVYDATRKTGEMPAKNPDPIRRIICLLYVIIRARLLLISEVNPEEIEKFNKDAHAYADSVRKSNGVGDDEVNRVHVEEESRESFSIPKGGISRLDATLMFAFIGCFSIRLYEKLFRMDSIRNELIMLGVPMSATSYDHIMPSEVACVFQESKLVAFETCPIAILINMMKFLVLCGSLFVGREQIRALFHTKKDPRRLILWYQVMRLWAFKNSLRVKRACGSQNSALPHAPENH